MDKLTICINPPFSLNRETYTWFNSLAIVDEHEHNCSDYNRLAFPASSCGFDKVFSAGPKKDYIELKRR